MIVTPSLVRALLDRNQRELWRMGILPPPSPDDDLELQNQRAIAAQLETEIRQFTAWLEATPTPPADPPPSAGRSQSD